MKSASNIGSRQRNLCPVVFFFAESFLIALGKEASLPNVFSLPRVFYLALGKAFFVESFLFGSRQRAEL
jgi:hypothetical protein